MFGVVITATVSAVVLTVFVRLIDEGGPWWLSGHNLEQGEWFEAARVTVALVALTVAGAAAYLAYRRQLTADQNQKTASETQRITARAYALSVSQHDEDRQREFRTRFADAAEQLAHNAAAVRLAGVYAMAALADDWLTQEKPAEAQTCVDVLCGYLRLPYHREHGETHQTKRVVTRPQADPDGSPAGEIQDHFEFRQNDREVRSTIVYTVVRHLLPAATRSWSGLDLDLRRAVLEDANFGGAIFNSSQTSFGGTKFYGKWTSFGRAQFRSERMSFSGAQFRSERTLFSGAQFRSEWTLFDNAEFDGEETTFDLAEFDGETSFDRAEFRSESTSFARAEFRSESTSFNDAKFDGESTSFDGAKFHGDRTLFHAVQFRSRRTSFDAAQFRSRRTLFDRAEFRSESTSFDRAEFHGEGTTFDDSVRFARVYFDWDPRPPRAPRGTKPSSVKFDPLPGGPIAEGA